MCLPEAGLHGVGRLTDRHRPQSCLPRHRTPASCLTTPGLCAGPATGIACLPTGAKDPSRCEALIGASYRLRRGGSVAMAVAQRRRARGPDRSGAGVAGRCRHGVSAQPWRRGGACEPPPSSAAAHRLESRERRERRPLFPLLLRLRLFAHLSHRPSDIKYTKMTGMRARGPSGVGSRLALASPQ